MNLLLSWMIPLLCCCGGSSEELTEITPVNVNLTLQVDEVLDATSASCTVQWTMDGQTAGGFEKGVCYSSTNTSPTVNDELSGSNGGGMEGSSSFTLQGLKALTVYYLRPYAKVGNEVFYGRSASLKTLGSEADYYPTPRGSQVHTYDGYTLVWSDEFDADGAVGKDWVFETGFVRNEELQWYQSDNASVKDGCLLIEGRRETVANPSYVVGSSDWKTNRPSAEYTSSCLTTQGKREFMYGRYEIRAKIPTDRGAWPAIWLLGNTWEWPMNGEIDILEYYLKNGVPSILANACWSSDKLWTAVWDESVTPFTHFTEKDEDWSRKYHVWRMDWDKSFIRLYLDDELLNEIDLSTTANQGYDGNFENPFNTTHEGFGHYLLLNLAIGSNGGTPNDEAFPLHYRVDYVRVYQ